MGSFGERLRRERETRGVSLDDIAEGTKIGTRLLRALEDEHFDLLPGGIFNKGFVRAYAKYLGLNEEELVLDYLHAAGESSPDPKVVAEQTASRIDRSSGDFEGSRMASFPLIPVLILLVVIAAGVGGWHLYQERMHERRARQDMERAAAQTASSTPGNPSLLPPTTTTPQDVASAGQSPAGIPAATPTTTVTEIKPASDLNASPQLPSAQPSPTQPSSVGNTSVPPIDATPTSTPAPTGQQFEVTVRPRDKAWVSIKTDGKIAVRGIIGPPDVKTLHATDQIVVWTGNAGAVDITFNGQPVPLTGGPNEVAVLVITPKGATAAKPPSAGRVQ